MTLLYIISSIVIIALTFYIGYKLGEIDGANPMPMPKEPKKNPDRAPWDEALFNLIEVRAREHYISAKRNIQPRRGIRLIISNGKSIK